VNKVNYCSLDEYIRQLELENNDLKNRGANCVIGMFISAASGAFVVGLLWLIARWWS